MASIGQLIRVVAEVSGLEEASVKLIARYIRESGFIAQQSTGGGAARMTSVDAASLLIAVNGSSLAKNAVESIGAYSELVSTGYTADAKLTPDLKSLLAELKICNDFGSALIRLIELCSPVDELMPILMHNPTNASVAVRVKFERPVYRAEIYISEIGNRPSESKSGFLLSFNSGDTIEIKSDRTVVTTIGRSTIQAVASLIFK